MEEKETALRKLTAQMVNNITVDRNCVYINLFLVTEARQGSSLFNQVSMLVIWVL